LTLGTWDEVVAETALVNGGGTIEVPLGYELKSFRLVHESGLASQGFLRVAVHQSTP
jgi:hypothetical protein